MRVIHIIPSAFEYFDDIRAEAFEMVDELNRQNITADAFALQYGAHSAQKKTDEEQIESGEKKPTDIMRKYVGMASGADALATLPDFDIVHLHCPFLGGARAIIKWRLEYPGQPFVISYYHPVPFTDLFSVFVRWYNNYYLPKIFKLSNVVFCDTFEQFTAGAGERYLRGEKKLVALGREGDIHLTTRESVVKLVEIYQLLLNSN